MRLGVSEEELDDLFKYGGVPVSTSNTSFSWTVDVCVTKADAGCGAAVGLPWS